MHKQIYVNLPVNDLKASMAFFTALGFAFEPKFTNEQAAAVVVGENIYAMLLPVPFFQGFTGKPVVDAKQATEMIVCISCESRSDVDAMVAKAVAAGGGAPRPAQDHGFMYGHGFEDLDGHIWELVSYAPAAA